MAGLPREGEAFGAYVIEGVLGRGGMGVVLRARQVDLGRQVALKLLPPELMTDDLMRRFRREARSLAMLDSPYVVQVYDAGEHDGWLYIATQLIPDGDLASLLETSGPLAPETALQIVDEVLSGLADAHDLGMLHRDVKPQNVLVRRTDGRLRTYLCDFGIAQALEGGYTQTVGVIGTMGYLAPERHLDQPASVQSDLYSVGCLLWALVTGSAPYLGSHLQIALGHQNGPIPQLAATGATGPGVARVDELLRVSMAKDPARRYPSAVAMRDVLRGTAGPDLVATQAAVPAPVPLEAFPPGLGPVAVPPAPPSPPVQPVPRRTARVVLGAVAVVVLVAGGGAAAAMMVGRSDGAASTAGAGPAVTSETSSSAPTDGVPSTSAQTEPVTPTGPAQDPTTRATPELPVVPETSAAPREPVATTTQPVVESQPAFVCWNTDRVDRLSDCDYPSGREGLDWVFPSLKGRDCSDLHADGTVDRPEAWQCLSTLPDGTEVKVNYSRWGTVSGAVANYGKNLDGPRDVYVGGTRFLSWTGIDKGDSKLARVYADAPYSFTVYAPTAAQRDRALATLVRTRSADTLRGEPAS